MTNSVAAGMLLALLACPTEVFGQNEPQERFALRAATKLGNRLALT